MFHCSFCCNGAATLGLFQRFSVLNTGADLDLTGRMLAKNGESGGCSPLSTSTTIIATEKRDNVIAVDFGRRAKAA